MHWLWWIPIIAGILTVLWVIILVVDEYNRPIIVYESNPNIGDFRIKPLFNGKFEIQEYGYVDGHGGIYRHTAWQVSKDKNKTHLAMFSTEEAAEKWIFEELRVRKVEAETKAENERIAAERKFREDNFYKLNPPREVPPYKFSH